MSKKEDVLKQLRREVYSSEAYLCGLFYNNPSLYSIYSDEKLSKEIFLNKIWAFYFQVGRKMAENKVTIFDDITYFKYIHDLNATDLSEQFGDYNTIEEIMEEVKGKEENLEAYYDEVKKYKMITGLCEVVGSKVVDADGKYDYHDLNRETIHAYWIDKINKAGMQGDSKFETVYLLKGLDTLVDRLDKEPDVGLEFFDSSRMTEITNGWASSEVYIFGSFSGRGKTSATIAKTVMSCIKWGEKLNIIANEQSADEWQKMLLITAMGLLKLKFNRKKLNKGNFTEEERANLNKAIEWLKEMVYEEDSLITLTFLEDYTIENLKRAIVYGYHRGYRSVIIDTAKPSEGDRAEMARWERFTEDMKEIYKLTKKNGGGLDLRMWVNVQLADGALNKRFLDEMALGESKKIKNEAGILWLGRTIWEDEYQGEKHELTCWRWVKNPDVEYNDDAPPYKKKEFTLPRFDKLGNPINYFLLFTGKNRRGQTNENGLGVLVFRVDYNNNTWQEMGFTSVAKDIA